MALVPLGAGAAFAHAGLVATNPESDAVLPRAPARFELTFSEPVSPLRMTLVDPSGAAEDLQGAAIAGNRLSIPAPASMADGTYRLGWRVVSVDGHPVAGSLLFSVGAASTPAPALPEEADRATRGFVWLSRLLLYLGLGFGIGGAASRLLTGGPLSAGLPWVRSALVLGLAAVPLAIAAQGLDALGAPLRALASPAVWQAGRDTGFGQTALIAVLSFALAIAGTFLRGGLASKLLATIAVLGAGAALASTGHAANAPPELVARPAVALHTIAAALWVGALLPLALALRQPDASGLDALRRFSARITPLVVLLLLSGGVLAVIQVETPAALWRTDYGRVLLAKLTLIALLFALAADNRWRLTRLALADAPEARRAMVRQIGFEIALAVAILGTVALWRFTPPPRIDAAIAAEPARIHVTGERLMGDILVLPGHAGEVEASAMLMTIDYGPVNPEWVGFAFSKPDGIGAPIVSPAQNRGDGVWRAEVTLPTPGVWRMQIDVRIDADSLDRLSGDITLRAPNDTSGRRMVEGFSSDRAEHSAVDARSASASICDKAAGEKNRPADPTRYC